MLTLLSRFLDGIFNAVPEFRVQLKAMAYFVLKDGQAEIISYFLKQIIDNSAVLCIFVF